MTRPRATPPDTERLIASARSVARVAHRPFDELKAKHAAADAALWLVDVARIYRMRRLAVQWASRAR